MTTGPRLTESDAASLLAILGRAGANTELDEVRSDVEMILGVCHPSRMNREPTARAARQATAKARDVHRKVVRLADQLDQLCGDLADLDPRAVEVLDRALMQPLHEATQVLVEFRPRLRQLEGKLARGLARLPKQAPDRGGAPPRLDLHPVIVSLVTLFVHRCGRPPRRRPASEKWNNLIKLFVAVAVSPLRRECVTRVPRFERLSRDLVDPAVEEVLARVRLPIRPKVIRDPRGCALRVRVQLPLRRVRPPLP